MLKNTLSQYIDIPTQEVDAFLNLTCAQIFANANYKKLIASLNRELLEETVGEAREAYRASLPHLSQHIAEHYNLKNPVMSPFTLGNWLVGFLYSPDSLPDLLARHQRVPTEAIREGLPELLGMLDNMPKARKEWQRALSILSLPLLAKQ